MSINKTGSSNENIIEPEPQRKAAPSHAAHPYPTDEELESLKAQTGLNETQIVNWLSNARRRGNVCATRSTSPAPHQYLNEIDIPRRATPPSSLGTSHSSGGSFGSAFSHKSRGSFGSFSSVAIEYGFRGRRRRRRQPTKPNKIINVFATPRTFQCTFCTESFKRKHDWQRHEKSLHLSLELWIRSPKGIVHFNAGLNAPACVYCGVSNPAEGHADHHNHPGCAERMLEERTFYRKDHLRQHLNLVHDAKFQFWSMDSWKVATPEIRSRCGFCGLHMESWSARVDQLGDHFRAGKSMADWKGDCGFASHVLDNVENGMPPYLIHDERNTMLPFSASNRESTNAGKTLEDKVKMDLVVFINERYITGTLPTDEYLLAEARRTLGDPEFTKLSWAERLDRTAIRNQTIMIAMNTIKCSKELSLKEYVKKRQALGLTPIDAELQIEACRILDEVEVAANYKCKGALQWFKYLVTSSPHWLDDFRRRAMLPRTEEMASMDKRSLDDTTIDYSIHNYHRLERGLIDFVAKSRSAGYIPTDEVLQKTARIIIFEKDDPWDQTAADDPNCLIAFKRHNGLLAPIKEEANTNPTVPLHYFLNDSNCYGHLVRELNLFITSTKSPNNPNQHVPIDAEIQNQARWIIYDGDDPWNQTVAFNDEWMIHIKRNCGLLPLESGPVLNFENRSWHVKDGGTGLSSPYLMPQPDKIVPSEQPVDVKLKNDMYVKRRKETASQYVKNGSTPYTLPRGFCSRDLENQIGSMIDQGLATGAIPSDEDLRAESRQVLGVVDKTAADGNELLSKFKASHGILAPMSVDRSGPIPNFDLPIFTSSEVDMLAAFSQELSTMDPSPTGRMRNMPLPNMSAPCVCTTIQSTPTAVSANKLNLMPQTDTFDFGINMEGIDGLGDLSNFSFEIPGMDNMSGLSSGEDMSRELKYADLFSVST
ncbi:hypothetical protein BJ878DRAFT_536178 [Calycina marina]|uniref:Uncharacterized protein n=1 Tax=Calycina marina TaxID=1763456 RepID=A0A9P8CCU8_9HELO|nr:hypothetical protein BJ878DRAFT_536178 [Calycina marina]